MAEGESRSDKFKRLATKRVQNAINKIESVGKLSAPAYQYTEEEIEKIFSSLQATLETAKAKFEKRKIASNKFEL